MSPGRTPSLKRTQTPTSKPYTRNITPTLLPSIPVHLPGNARAQVYDSRHIAERPGFPSYAQFKQIESSYIESLTPRRQGKALISQSMFDRIWDVLHHPESQLETAQFRFWARKMFVLNKNHRVTLGVPEGVDVQPQEVLLHDNLLVAIQEQLYDILCYCHGSTGHGGRDKTCGLIRKHYTWVPKDLVSNFIKACPTCILKKCGNMDVNASLTQALSESEKLTHFNREEEDVSNHLQSFSDTVYSRSGMLSEHARHLSWPTMEGSPFSVSPDPQFDSQDPSESCSRGEHAQHHSGAPCNHFHPMVREVSLYKGIPNGWQYRHDDYATAHAEFMEYKKHWENNPMPEDPDPRMRAMRPRIPSIAPLWGPDDFPANLNEEDDYEHELHQHQLPQHFALPPMIRSLEISESSLPPSLQHLLMNSPRLSSSYIPQIDPALLELSSQVNSYTEEYISVPESPTITFKNSRENRVDHGATGEPVLPSFASSSSIKRVGAPPALHLDISATQKTFQALLDYRDTLGSGNNSPDGASETSPTSSVDSCSSQLSAFPLTTTSSISPETSALTTPVDECDESEAAMSVKGKGKALPKNVDMELSSSIQAMCGF